MRMKDQISKAFAYYFRCVEEIMQFLKDPNENIQRALNQCVEQIRDLGVFGKFVILKIKYFFSI